MRLYCAQVAASKHTADDLLQAIALVAALPPDHPLRPEINRSIEEWSLDMLALGNEEFHAGNLKEALAIAHKIPHNVSAAKSVEKRVQIWRSIWSEAKGIYQDTEAEIRQQQWHRASMDAVRLLNVGNNYWATTKYEELNNRIETTRQDANNLAKAQTLAKSGKLNNLLAALKLVESIDSNSYIYQDVKAAIPEFGRKLLDLAQETLEQRDAEEAIMIVNQIPASANLQLEAQDFITLAEAYKSAWIGTTSGLQGAIAIAQKIDFNRPLYNKGQELISRWTLEIQDVAHLDRARKLAQGGKIGDLRAAITEAELIPDNNPRSSERDQVIASWRGQVETTEDSPYLNRAEQMATPQDINSLQAAIVQASQIAKGRALYEKAQSEIRTWNRTIEQIQDQPYLDQAEQTASLGDINSLQTAIAQASQIASGRALYEEAQSKIRTWNRTIEQTQDQPYLDQARELARSGDLSTAIATAIRIPPGRALSGEAKAAIDDWQGQILAQQNWQNARQIALQGTPEALREAIRVGNLVPLDSPLRSSVNDAVNQWSHQMLSIAQNRGQYDVPGAIAIAKQIPVGTDAYSAAQEQIGIWQKTLPGGTNRYNAPPARTERQPQSPKQSF